MFFLFFFLPGEDGLLYFPPPAPPKKETVTVEPTSEVKPCSADEAKLALLRYIAGTCCWGSGPAQKSMSINSLEGFSSIVVKYETFVEYRTAKRVSRPYMNENCSLKGNLRYTPNLWQMQVPPQPFFHDHVDSHEVPNTSEIKQCTTCGGDGKVTCSECRGTGKDKCNGCGGDGKVTRTEQDGETTKQVTESCGRCGGDGKVTCTHHDCNGSGRNTCATCAGHGRLRFFDEMTRTHKTLVTADAIDRIPDNEIEPQKMTAISATEGRQIFNHSSANMNPPVGFNPEVDAALVRLNQQAEVQTQQLKAFMHQERLTVTCMEATKVKATIDGKEFHFWVYGNSKIVECKPDWGYPAQMFCGACSVM